MLVLLFPVLSAVLFYLFSRAVITTALWSRYPRWLASYADCPACVGFLFHLIIAIAAAQYQSYSFFGLTSSSPITWLVIAFTGIWTTPIFANWHHQAMINIGSAVAEIDDDQEQL